MRDMVPAVAIMLEILTDNRNRTAGEIRYLFNKYGGNLGETGCVSWMFDKKGSITVQMGSESEDDFMLAALEAGAEDVVVADGLTGFHQSRGLPRRSHGLSRSGLQHPTGGDHQCAPKHCGRSGEEAAQLVKLIEALEDNDDVQEVYANYDIPDEILEQLSS